MPASFFLLIALDQSQWSGYNNVADVEKILTEYRERIIQDWVHRLRTGVSQRYHEQPPEELFITVTATYDSSPAVLLKNDFFKPEAES